IFVFDGLCEFFSVVELHSVFVHERHHVRRRDLLRRIVAQALADGLWFVPGLRSATHARALVGELAVDAVAVVAIGVQALAAALIALGAAAEAARVDHLLGHRAPRGGDRLTWAIMVSLAALAVWLCSSASERLCLPLAVVLFGLLVLLGLGLAC